MQHRKVAARRKAEDLQQFEEMCRRREEYVSVAEADIDQKRRDNMQNQTKLEEAEEELKEAKKGFVECRHV